MQWMMGARFFIDREGSYSTERIEWTLWGWVVVVGISVNSLFLIDSLVILNWRQFAPQRKSAHVYKHLVFESGRWGMASSERLGALLNIDSRCKAQDSTSTSPSKNYLIHCINIENAEDENPEIDRGR